MFGGATGRTSVFRARVRGVDVSRGRIHTRVMSDILAALPGMPLRVSEVVPALAKYWQESAEEGTSSRASQMNLVIVFGAGVEPAEAAERMDGALSLARRYPCRILTLCPDNSPGATMSGRLHIACFPTSNGRDQRCGEALSLGFPASLDPAVLDSQVSVWLESDIPTYVWLHGVTPAEIPAYAPMLKTARRVVYDSSRSAGDFSGVWPKPEIVRDLASARLLAVRQALGQFLSAYAPATLVSGLTDVVVRHAPSRSGEAVRLMEWMRAALNASSVTSKTPLAADFRIELKTDCDACLSTAWRYTNGDAFSWEHAPQGSGAQIAAHIAGVSFTHPLRVPFLDQPASLAEALFF